MRDRFKDSRTQSDFLYMLTTRRHNPKTETIREYSHALHNLVVRAYPQMPDDQRMQILKQKFLSSINAEDLEKSVISDKLAKATYQEVADLVSKVEEFRKTKERCKPRADDDWFVNPMTEERGHESRSYPGSRSNNRYPKDRQNYRPRTYPEDRECHYCGEVGHLQYRCPKRLEDRQKGIERPIIQKNAKRYAQTVEETTIRFKNAEDQETINKERPMTAYPTKQSRETQTLLMVSTTRTQNTNNLVTPKAIRTPRETKTGRSPNRHNPRGKRKLGNHKQYLFYSRIQSHLYPSAGLP